MFFQLSTCPFQLFYLPQITHCFVIRHQNYGLTSRQWVHDVGKLGSFKDDIKINESPLAAAS